LPSEATVLQVNGVAVADTFAEAFPIVGTRVIVTAITARWADIAADGLCGFATSVIACNAEVAVECRLTAENSPDGRPGVSVLLFAFNRDSLAKAVQDRIGQCILTCPTTACYNGIQVCSQDEQISIGGQLRYFGDGFQSSKKLGTRRFWRIPVMDGEFVCEDRFGTAKGVAGGNLLICGADQVVTLSAAETAVNAIRELPDTVLPFPGGIVRSGSKVGSRYKKLKASTNDAYCPTLRQSTSAAIPDGVGAVYEIVIDGLSLQSVQQAMRIGLHATSECPGVKLISAGNYGGKLGRHHLYLRDLL